MASVETDVPAWKADHTAVNAATDQELHEYCAIDVAVTAQIVQPLAQQARERSQEHLYNRDAQLQELCWGMKRMGIRVDDSTRLAHARRLTKERNAWYDKFVSYAGDVNPNSPPDIRELIFEKWGLPAHDFTPAGEPSTNAASLRALLSGPLEERHRRAIESLRRYRKADKLITTYLNKWAPGLGIVDSAGYAYYDYNSHGTVMGRFSSGIQTIPWGLRDIFVPGPGMVFVGADFDQLELRFGAALAGANHYLDAFEKKEIDPHNLTGVMMFGDTFWTVEGAPKTPLGKGKGQFKQLRDLAKAICFSSLYGAAPPKVHEILLQAEDKDGNLLFSHYSLREVRTLHRKWMKAAPEFKQWWERELEHWRQHGYVQEPIYGRRRYFHEEDFNAIVNTPVQGGGFAVVAEGMLDCVKHIPFDFQRKVGLVTQLHDAVLFQVPEAEADRACEIVTQNLTAEYRPR